ncbi:unnamed protein product [Lymnaea stagnalis]|uniref:N-lysine methyltransferase n=1 Tax=Lymnaea stagnalis TaxID=6523 RepID=A0AAV2HU24_LYMST
MATPVKRKRESFSNCNHDLNSNQKQNIFSDAPDKLKTFTAWCASNKFNISRKVQVGREGSCAQYGMTAVEDIPEGYCLFQVPRTSLLMPHNTNIAGLIEQEKSKLAATNQWVPLLISLLHEENNPTSKWRPYLDLFPDFETLDLPMFWERSDIEKLLRGTGVDLAVERDLKMIRDDYNKLVLPFFDRHSDEISKGQMDLDYFKKMVAFVMSYSFTEPRHRRTKNSENSNSGDSGEEESDSDDDEPSMLPPMMVPLADTLNHITHNNAKLTFGKEALKMVAARPIKKGEEIFNTYGQVSNLHLMHMYGFAEPYPDNTNDVVEIPVVRIFEAAKDLHQDKESSYKSHLDVVWAFLIEQELILADDIFVLGREGIITDDICIQALKVLSMDKQQFVEYTEKEGWSDAESDTSLAEDSRLELAKIPSLVDVRWKQLLKRMGQLHLNNYTTTLEEDEAKLRVISTLTSQEKFALYTAHGQKMLIKLLIDACS